MIGLFSLLVLIFCPESDWEEMTIKEGLRFEVPQGWSYFSSTGSIEQGAMQITYSFEEGIQTADRFINPMIVVTLDKASWFDDEKDYLKQKIEFHHSMGDAQQVMIRPGGSDNPLEIKATYMELSNGLENNPAGQKLVTATTLNEKFGLHFQLYTDVQHFSENKEVYQRIFNSIQLF